MLFVAAQHVAVVPLGLLLENRPHHLPSSARQDRQQRIAQLLVVSASVLSSREHTYTVRRLAASLQPHASVLADLVVLKVHPVVSPDLPLRIFDVAPGHQVSCVLQQRLVEVAEVSRRDENSVKVHRLGLLLSPWRVAQVQRALVSDMQTNAVLEDRRRLDVGHQAVR